MVPKRMTGVLKKEWQTVDKLTSSMNFPEVDRVLRGESLFPSIDSAISTVKTAEPVGAV